MLLLLRKSPLHVRALFPDSLLAATTHSNDYINYGFLIWVSIKQAVIFPNLVFQHPGLPQDLE